MEQSLWISVALSFVSGYREPVSVKKLHKFEINYLLFELNNGGVGWSRECCIAKPPVSAGTPPLSWKHILFHPYVRRATLSLKFVQCSILTFCFSLWGRSPLDPSYDSLWNIPEPAPWTPLEAQPLARVCGCASSGVHGAGSGIFQRESYDLSGGLRPHKLKQNV